MAVDFSWLHLSASLLQPCGSFCGSSHIVPLPAPGSLHKPFPWPWMPPPCPPSPGPLSFTFLFMHLPLRKAVLKGSSLYPRQDPLAPATSPLLPCALWYKLPSLFIMVGLISASPTRQQAPSGRSRVRLVHQCPSWTWSPAGTQYMFVDWTSDSVAYDTALNLPDLQDPTSRVSAVSFQRASDILLWVCDTIWGLVREDTVRWSLSKAWGSHGSCEMRCILTDHWAREMETGLVFSSQLRDRNLRQYQRLSTLLD